MSSDDLLTEHAPDAEDFVVSWLQPIIRAAVERKTEDEFPFAIVQYITGTDSVDHGTEDGVIQIDVLDEARDGVVAVQAAKYTADQVHRRMMFLARHIPDVTMSDSSVANCDYLNTTEKFHRQPYQNDKVVRYTARYALGLSYVAV
jgi:hypothetical protein